MEHDNAFAIFHGWWEDIARRRPPETTRTYRGLVSRALADLGLHPCELTSEDVASYLATKRTQHANLIRNGLADFTSYLKRHGFRQDDPLEAIPARARINRHIKRGLTADELTRLAIAGAWLGPYRRRWEGARLAQLFLAQAWTGIRPGELISLTTADVDFERREIRVLGTKTGVERIVPLSVNAYRVFEELCRGRVGRICNVGRSQYWQLMKKASIAARLPAEKSRPYALRHTFGGLLVRAGVHQRVISELMGHEDPRSTMVYTVPDDDLMRDAVEAIHT